MSPVAIDDKGECEPVVIIATAESPHAIRVAPSDIDACIGFSAVLCAATILGLLLVLTDIPRTGFGLSSMKDYFTVVGLDTIMYFGPYAYHVLHAVKQENATFYGPSAGSTMNAIDVWAYKFDSLSIPTRALAAHLNVTMYPRCVLYPEHCSDVMLPLEAAFTMVDGMISAVVKPFTRHTELRTHNVHFFGPSVIHDQAHLHICHPHWYRFSQADRPLLCDFPVQWMSAHPQLGASVQVPIWEHLALRLESLKTQYPELHLDLTIIASRLALWNKSWAYLSVIRFATQTLEMSTFVRGQRCVMATTNENPETPVLDCSTVFVDDYRCGRALVLSDAEGWHICTSLLRGARQLFMWFRIVSLVTGCYAARAVELKFHCAKWYTKLYYTVSALAKIPSRVITYGNWLAIVCYAVAHFIGGALVHLISNTVWSTVNGVVDFQLVKYFTIASIQMRNIWFVALYLKLVTIAHQKILCAHTRRWTVQHGIVGFAVGNASEYGFRFDIKTLGIAAIVATLAGLVVHALLTLVESGAKPKSTDMLTLSCHSYYVPHSAKTLWPAGSALVYWRMKLIHSSAFRYGSSSSVAPAPDPMGRPIVGPESARHEASLGLDVCRPPECLYCGYSRRQKSLPISRWHVIQGCSIHNNLIDMDTRSCAHWSAVRLANIAMLADPFVLLKLFVVGQQFFVYRSISIRESRRQLSPRVALGGVDIRRPLPATLAYETECLPQVDTMEMDDATAPRSRLYLVPYKLRDALTSFMSMPECVDKEIFLMRYELIATTHSATLPWHLLVNCG